MAVPKKSVTPSKFSGKLSLVIPCYNEEQRVDQMIAGLREFAQRATFDYEVIIVDDGSTDKTQEVIRENKFIKQSDADGKFKLVSLPVNKGKGAALKAGVEAATGTHILTLDADMATRPVEVFKWLAASNQQFPEKEIWIASREHRDSKVTEYAMRRRTGRMFNLIVRLLTPLRFRDTQCGFKLYPAAIAKELFSKQKSTGWAHDVELLYRAHISAIPVRDLPVTWVAQDGTKISPAKDSLPMLLSVIGVALRMKWEYFFGGPIRQISSRRIPTERRDPGDVFSAPKSDSIFRMLFATGAIILFFLMTSLSFDYGITGDDLDQKLYGEKVLNFYTSFGKDTSCLHLKVGNKENLYIYGGLFNMISAAANRYIDGLDEYDMRHLINAIAGFLAILFAGLLARRIGNWMTGFLALVLLGTWPQFFGQSMNNPKDIPFALGYVMTIYYLVKLVKELPRPSFKTWAMTTIAIAFTINIRVGGLLLIGMLFAFVFGTYILDPSRRKLLRDNSGYILKRMILVSVIGYFGGLIFWPYGIMGPLSHPFAALKEMSNFSMGIGLLFDGKMMSSRDISWNYIPQWLWITTPLVVLFAAMAFAFIWYLARKLFPPHLTLLLVFAVVFPWAYAVYGKSPLYDGLRQFLFIVPLIAVMAALSWHYVLSIAKQNWMRYAVTLLLAAGIFLPVRFSFANHPNEYVYFNELIGGVRGAHGNYVTDYYMNSIRKTSEWFRQSEMFKNASREKKILLATNAVDPVNWYFRNDTDKVKVVFTKWNSPGNPKTRGAREWDYGIYFSREIDPSILKAGTWPSQKAVYINAADGVPLSAVIERSDKSDFLGYQAMQKDSLQLAEKYFEAALKYNPQNEEAAFWMTQVELSLQKPKEALRYAELYLQLYPASDQGYVMRGVAYAYTGDFDNAVSNLDYAIRLNSMNVQAYRILGQLYQQRGDAQTAEQYFSGAKRIEQIMGKQ